jgi:hypothetical protein
MNLFALLRLARRPRSSHRQPSHPSRQRAGRRAVAALGGFGFGGSALGGGALMVALSGASVLAAPPACAASLPYPEAVQRSGVAARAVLAREGRESCLRGKLTNALLGLSSSCEKEARRDPLCALADRAVVVTPMSLAFMDATSRDLLRLIAPTSPVPAAQGRPDPEASGGETP